MAPASSKGPQRSGVLFVYDHSKSNEIILTVTSTKKY